MYSDPSGLDAIVVGQSEGVSGLGHMIVFFQDENDDWFFFFYGGTVNVQRVYYTEGLDTIEGINKFIRHYNLNLPDDPDYDRFVYIKGDFTASLTYANEQVRLFNDVRYPEADPKIQSGFPNWNPNYDALSNNCAQQTVIALSKGKMANGTSVEAYWDSYNGYGSFEKTMLGYNSISKLNSRMVPNLIMNDLQKMFYNTASNLTQFNTQMADHRNGAKNNPLNYINPFYWQKISRINKYIDPK